MQVYLAVPLNADTYTVKKVLRARDANPREHQDFTEAEFVPQAGKMLPKFWDEVDAVVAFPQMRGGANADSVLIDIGIAIGRGLPVIVLTEDEDLILKLSSQPVITARAGLDTEDALDSHLSLFLAGARQPLKLTSVRVPKGPGKFSPEIARRELDRIQTLSGAEFHVALEAWVETLLRNLQVSMASTRGPDRGFDFVFSSSNSQQFSGPILVEVKGKVPYSSIEKSALRLQGLVIRERAALGVLLYLDVKKQRQTVPALPGVVVIGVYELVEALSSKRSLDSVLWQARNEVVHKQ